MKINYKLLRVVRTNVIYIIGFITFVLLLSIYSYIQIKSILATQNKIVQTKREIAELHSQQQVLAHFNPDELDKLSKKLNDILPGNEDYFSIFNSLEKMASATGITFTSFTSPFGGASLDGVSVTAQASGSISSFSNFLHAYQLAGGRVATIESVTINPPQLTAVFQIKFHSKPVNIGKVRVLTLPDEKTIELLNSIETSTQTIATDESFSSTTNPFGQ